MSDLPDKYTCEVVYNAKLADNVFALTVVSRDLAAEVRAGQFLHIKCGEERLLRRPVSICRVRGGTLEFVIEVKGEGTRWLSKREPGNKLDILGPLGKGFYVPDGRIIAVGGGIGAPPMLFVAETATCDVTAVIGFRSIDRIILEKEFAAVCEKVYITTDDGSSGLRGSVTEPLQELLDSGGYSAVLACGPHAMLSAVARLCRFYNIPCQVSMEERMGCGVGACLVCACATVSGGNENKSRICKDGPVFDAEEIIW